MDFKQLNLKREDNTPPLVEEWKQIRNKGGASGALAPGTVHVGAQNE
jgi:hypothetical protein